MNAQYSVEKLQNMVEALALNDGFGCYTRNGFELTVWPQMRDQAKWIIFFDIDGMHALDEKYGYDRVDAMIKPVLLDVRSTDYVAGQWLSGDEFIICITDRRSGMCDPQGMVDRLVDGLKQNGISATFAIAPVVSRDLAENVAPAIEQVCAAKKQRGCVR